eukprot:scaffold6981_cov118-Skeletonema_dohrnii-CCMP3373.AAC.8
MATSLLWIAATLLALPSSINNNVATAEILTHHHVGGANSASLHKTWGKFIQRQSLTTTLASSKTESTSTAALTNTNNNVGRRTSRLAKLPCFVRRLPTQQQSPLHKSTRQSMVDVEWSLATGQIITKIRGGATNDDDDEYDSTTDGEHTTDGESSDEEEYDDEYDEEYESDYDDESDEEEEEEDNIVSSLTSSSLKSSLRSKSTSTEEEQIAQYDEVLAPPAMQQLVISLGVMFLSQRIDILDAKTVRIARFAFVAYIVTMQLFLLYVRFRAKAINDRTEITLSNPLASLVQGAAGGAMGGAGAAGGGGNFMVKALADQMLSSTTTIYEYDVSQAKKMNSGLLMPMVFLYFLHFRMKQVQPLLMQTATGVMNMVYSPLFQVYVLGRNLERPFKSPGSSMMDALQQTEEEGDESESSSEPGVEEVEGDGADVDDEEEEAEDSEGESDAGEEESDGDESDYDTDEE